MKVGLIGLGSMGLPIAKCISKNFPVMAWAKFINI